MLVNPVQQSPFSSDPARQLVTPPVVVQPPPPLPVLNAAVSTPGTPQDKANTGSDGKSGSGADPQAQQEQIADQLRAALLQLEQLREEARAALVAGDTQSAKEAAQEAAGVAGSIRDLTGSAPSIGIGVITQQAQIQQQQSGAQSGQPPQPPSFGSGQSDPGGGSQDGLPQVFDLAFSGLDTANDVVDAAASLPAHAAVDQASIASYKKAVLDALADVAEIASKVATAAPVKSGGKSSGLDIRV